MSIAEKETPILVTTVHRGVFFGYFDSSESAGENGEVRYAEDEDVDSHAPARLSLMGE